MNSKLVMIRGFAFDEEKDIQRLEILAKEGWILEKVICGLFFRLRKDKPQEVRYFIDYQDKTDDDYFEIFNESGWQRIVTVAGLVHIFIAQANTNKIYNSVSGERSKYVLAVQKLRGMRMFSSIFTMLTTGITILFLMFVKQLFLISLALLFLCMITIVFIATSIHGYEKRLEDLS